MNTSTTPNRKPIHGIGINDADYATFPKINGKRVRCPFYAVWKSMIERCYSDKCQIKHPTYIGCTVCDEWLVFSNFRLWMMSQDWHGKQLDKDILTQDNKEYSPSKCLFVSSRINLLFTDSKAARGKYPVGVNLSKKKYQARCCYAGQRYNVGIYDTPLLAFDAYKDFKYKVIAEIADLQKEPLKSAMLAYKIRAY